MTMENNDKSVRRESRLAVFEHVVQKDKDSKKKRFVPNRLESDESSPSDLELIIDDEKNEANKNKKLLVRFSEEPLSLRCEWNCCKILFNSWREFNIHLLEHASSESGISLQCLWKNCYISCDTQLLLYQHISYHGYLSKLKSIGQNVLERNDLPACRQTESYVIPISPDGYGCLWELCSVNVDTVYDFFTHVEQHVRGNPRIAKGKDKIVCYWGGCNSHFSTRYKLGEHVRTHTKEKTIGCPTCGTLFSNKTKFCDHRRRQLSTDLQSYQCSQCLKLFPTERLLRDHMRSHINHYKCTMCDMTCPKPSILALHMRFKHVKYKPFACTECDKVFVTKYNLLNHLETHKGESMHCDLCDFKCRTKVGLQSHYVKKHDQFSVVYQCHCCKKNLKRGGSLTKHLMKLHNYHWPSGHTRFRYRKDQDGIYRLQTVRYESLEVTAEMIKSETRQSKKSFSLKYDNECPSSHVLSIHSDNEDDDLSGNHQNDVVITINDVDEHGNIVNSQIMKTKEILAKTSDVLLEDGFSVEIDKNITVFTKDPLREELNEFVKLPNNEDHLNYVSKKNSRKSSDKKRKNRKNTSDVTKQKNIEAGNEEHNSHNENSTSVLITKQTNINAENLEHNDENEASVLSTKQADIKANNEEHNTYNESDASVLKKGGKWKRKRKQNFEKPVSKLKTDDSKTNVKYSRRSQRLRSVK